MVIAEKRSEHMKDLVMEPSVCVCGSSDDVTLFERRDLMLDSPLTFRVGRCTHCGVERLNPRPTPKSILAFYPFDPSSYEPYQKIAGGGSLLSRLRRWDHGYGLRKRLRAVERYVQRGRLLDVGAASGAFLSEVAQSSAWQAEGVELNAIVAEMARTQGLTVSTGTVESCAFPDNHFDAITLWDVFEHLHSPSDTLAELSRILRPGGILLMSTPNLASWDRHIFGRYWIGYELPRHLYLFDAENARPFLEEHDFELVDVRSFFGSHAYFMTSLRFYLTDNMKNSRLRQAIVKLMFTIPVRLLMIPYFFVADRLRRTTTMTLFARKRTT